MGNVIYFGSDSHSSTFYPVVALPSINRDDYLSSAHKGGVVGEVVGGFVGGSLGAIHVA